MLDFIEKQRCFYCRKPSLHGFTHPLCKKELGVDATLSLYVYNPFLKKLLKTAKYRLAKEAFKELLQISTIPLGLLLYSQRSLFRNLPVLPIPLHRSRMRSRGFNQAETICQFLQTLHSEVRVIDVLERCFNTAPQAQMKTRLRRYRNMSGVFRVKRGMLPTEVLLVDDVITTGSTIRSATETLKRAGVTHVYAFSLGHG